MMRHRSLGDGRGRSRLRLLGLAVLVLLGGRSAGAVEPAAPDDAFVSDHCTSCHNDVSKKGQLDLTGLAFDASDPANLAVWIKVHDRVKAGEMPPRGKARPDADRQKAFVEGLARSIVSAERAALAGEGRAIRRRLNRHEYENALRDLLGVPWAQVASRLPEDGEAYHFNKSGEALDVSYVQIARFMDSADHAMRLAMAAHLDGRPARPAGFMLVRRSGSGRARASTRSMLSGYTAVLASPGFVFLDEKPGKLDDYALATRLALFLWNSVPDDTLRSLAERGELHRPEVLRAEAERMLDDPRGTPLRRGVPRLLARPPQDRGLHPFDDALQRLLPRRRPDRGGPRGDATLLRRVLQHDLPARTRRLRLHVPQRAAGDALRHPRRDGRSPCVACSCRRTARAAACMTQASVLKVTANGTTTSPVLRGALDHGAHPRHETPPPPPTSPAVEPDIRGAVTIRQQLAKHRASTSCAACHSKIDPPGFALESFDVMGGFRERYRAVSENVPPVRGFGLNGQAFAFHHALPIRPTRTTARILEETYTMSPR